MKTFYTKIRYFNFAEQCQKQTSEKIIVVGEFCTQHSVRFRLCFIQHLCLPIWFVCSIWNNFKTIIDVLSWKQSKFCVTIRIVTLFVQSKLARMMQGENCFYSCLDSWVKSLMAFFNFAPIIGRWKQNFAK